MRIREIRKLISSNEKIGASIVMKKIVIGIFRVDMMLTRMSKSNISVSENQKDISLSNLF